MMTVISSRKKKKKLSNITSFAVTILLPLVAECIFRECSRSFVKPRTVLVGDGPFDKSVGRPFTGALQLAATTGAFSSML